VRIVFFIVATVIVASVAYFIYENIGAPPPLPEGAVDPKISKEEVLALAKPILQPMRDVLYPPDGLDRGLTPAAREQVVGALRDFKVKYGHTEGGQEAMRELSTEIRALALAAKDEERWVLVAGLIDAHSILGLESLVIERLDERAVQMLAKPTVVVRGVVDDLGKNVTYVLMDLIHRETGEVRRERARVGDILGDLRVREIIGTNKVIIFDYLPIEGLTFEVEFS
jgi:hypothetical protein